MKIDKCKIPKLKRILQKKHCISIGQQQYIDTVLEYVFLY